AEVSQPIFRRRIEVGSAHATLLGDFDKAEGNEIVHRPRNRASTDTEAFEIFVGANQGAVFPASVIRVLDFKPIEDVPRREARRCPSRAAEHLYSVRNELARDRLA